MIKNKKGNQTIMFHNRPRVLSAYAVVGTKEGQGPLGQWFDTVLEENTYGEKTWEKSESKMLKTAMMEALHKSGKSKEEIGAMLSGDLLNQLMSSSFMARDLHIPFLGMYGACSTMTESLMLGAVLTDGQYNDNVIIGASSHYCTAERQFRMPLEHGNQRPPSAQWTATAAGAMVLSCCGQESGTIVVDQNAEAKTSKTVHVTCGTIGKVIDAGIKDANQMGAAMAPAAVDTLLNHFQDTGRPEDYYDMILTGDLGYIGKDIAKDLLKDAGLSQTNIDNCYDDCGAMIFEKEQDTHGGGSGCGCSASVFAGYVFKQLRTGKQKRALIVSTGALLSTISPFQGESIPGIAHAISLEVE